MANTNQQAVINLVLNGKQAETNIKDITKTVVSLKRELYSMNEADNPALYKQKAAEMQKMLQTQIRMRQEAEGTASGWQKLLKNGAMVTGVLGGNLATMGLQKLTELFPLAISKGSELKDSMADIEKATGMSSQEVKSLNEELKGLDTRTPTKDLREMAVVAGQFGVATKDVGDFVVAADKLNVALGDQFNSAEETAGTMITLRNILQDIKSDKIDQDMLHIGNAINVLEAAGSATAPVIADFTSRIGGIAIPLGMSSGQVLGLSASLQEMNITAERGSTAMVDILNGMAKAPGTFAKYAVGVDGAKLSSKQFKDLVNTDLMGALLSVVRGFNQGDTSATGMAKKLDNLGLKGNGVMEVFMKMASNTELVEQKVKLAGDAVSKTDSIMGEFNKKNHDLAINLKRLSEWFDNILTGDGIQAFTAGILEATVKLLGLNNATKDATEKFQQQKNQVQQLESTLPPLLSRYNELKEKTTLNKDEQAELKTVIGQVANIVPSAVTEWDKYGNALGINTEKALEFIKVQKAMMQYQNKEAIEANEKDLQVLEREQKKLLNKLNSKKETTAVGMGQYVTSDISDQHTSEYRKKLQEIEAKAENVRLVLKGLKGEMIETVEPPVKPKPNGSGSGGNGSGGEDDLTKEEKRKLEAKKKANQEALYDIREMEIGAIDDDKTRKLAKLEFDAQKRKDDIRASTADTSIKNKAILQIDQALKVQKQNLEDEYAEKDRLKQKKHLDQLRKDAEEELELKRETAKYELALDVASGKVSEFDAKGRELQIEENFLTAKKILYEASYQAIADLGIKDKEKQEQMALARKDALLAIDQGITENRRNQVLEGNDLELKKQKYGERVNKTLAESERQLVEAKGQAFQQGVSLLTSFFKESSAIHKGLFLAEKAVAIASIIVNLNKQLAAIRVATAVAVAQATAMGPAGIPFIVAAKVAGAANLVSAKIGAATSIASIAAQTFQGFAGRETGGYTGVEDLYSDNSGNPEGYVTRPTLFNLGRRSYIAGEGGKKEYVVSYPMLQNPAVANFVGMLESQRKGRMFADGGYTGQPQGMSTGPVMTTSPAAPTSDNAPLIDELRQMRRSIDAQNQRPLFVNYRIWQEFDDRLKEIKRSVTF